VVVLSAPLVATKRFSSAVATKFCQTLPDVRVFLVFRVQSTSRISSHHRFFWVIFSLFFGVFFPLGLVLCVCVPTYACVRGCVMFRGIESLA
jgi:hypothetical protein